MGFWNTNLNLKYDFDHYLKDNFKLSYGINNIYTKFNPGKIAPNREDSGILLKKLTDKYANEFAAYIEADQKISANFTLKYGLRFSNFTRLGQDELNVYTNDTPVLYNQELQKYEPAVETGIETYRRSDIIANFQNFEPRVSFSYLLNEESSIKASL